MFCLITGISAAEARVCMGGGIGTRQKTVLVGVERQGNGNDEHRVGNEGLQTAGGCGHGHGFAGNER